jgi:hypothetical protein
MPYYERAMLRKPSSISRPRCAPSDIPISDRGGGVNRKMALEFPRDWA